MTDERTQAERFSELFRAVYLTFHRRDGPRNQLPSASRAVLEHLALAGPLTVGEAASHLSRAQSVVSEIVTHLERQGLLEREADPDDRRRTLIWLHRSGDGLDYMAPMPAWRDHPRGSDPDPGRAPALIRLAG